MTVASSVETPWMTAGETADYSRSSIDTVRDALASGELRGSQIKTGGRWRVHREDVDAWLRAEVAPAQVPRITRARN